MVNIEKPPAPMGPQRKRDLLLRTPSCIGFTLEGPLGASRASVTDPHVVETRALTPPSPYFLSLPKLYSSRRYSNEHLPTAGTHPTLLKSLSALISLYPLLLPL